MCSRWANSACSCGRLRADADEGRAVARELLLRVAEGAALRRAAARTGDVVPAVEQRLARHARARVDVDDEALARRLGEVELAAQRRGQGDGGNLGARAGDRRRRRRPGTGRFVGEARVVGAHDGHSRLWSARVRAHRVRVPDRRRRLGRVRARRAAERGRARRLPGRGRPRLRALRRRALAARHPRRAPARLLARVGDRARGPLAAARADHGRLLGAQRVRRPGRRARPTTTSGARAGATRPSRRTSSAPSASCACAGSPTRSSRRGIAPSRRPRAPTRSCTRSTTWARCAGTPPSPTSTRARGRENLTIRADTLVDRVLFAGDRADGRRDQRRRAARRPRRARRRRLRLAGDPAAQRRRPRCAGCRSARG